MVCGGVTLWSDFNSTKMTKMQSGGWYYIDCLVIHVGGLLVIHVGGCRLLIKIDFLNKHLRTKRLEHWLKPSGIEALEINLLDLGPNHRGKQVWFALRLVV